MATDSCSYYECDKTDGLIPCIACKQVQYCSAYHGRVHTFFRCNQYIMEQNELIDTFAEKMRLSDDVAAVNQNIREHFDWFSTDGFSPLILASYYNNSMCLKAMIDANASVDYGHHDYGSSPLYYAARRGNVDCLKLLLAAKADMNKRGEKGITPVLAATMKGQLETLKILLDARADVDCASIEGTTAVNFAAGKDNVVTLKLLIDAKANVNIPARDGTTPVLSASKNRDSSCVKMLLNAQADVNFCRDDGSTPLMVALSTKCSHVELLLRAKADVNAVTNDGQYTAVKVATLFDEPETLQLLIKAQANVNTPESVSKHASPLHEACALPSFECVNILLEAKALVTACDASGRTPLWSTLRAAHGQNFFCNSVVDIAQLLLSNGANVWAESEVRNGTPMTMMIASLLDEQPRVSRENRLRILKSFMKQGPSEDGITGLMCAASYGWAPSVQVLLDTKACDENAEDKNGMTAFMMALVQRGDGRDIANHVNPHADKRAVIELLRGKRTDDEVEHMRRVLRNDEPNNS